MDLDKPQKPTSMLFSSITDEQYAWAVKVLTHVRAAHPSYTDWDLLMYVVSLTADLNDFAKLARDVNGRVTEYQLKAKTATDARREVKQTFPKGGKLFGYNADGDCVYISAVRARGDKHHVATAIRGTGKATRFVVDPAL